MGKSLLRTRTKEHHDREPARRPACLEPRSARGSRGARLRCGASARPGKTLGIVGLILAILLPIIGLVLSIVAVVQSRKAGASNIPGVIGIIIGALGTIGYIILIVSLVSLAGVGMDAAQQCLNGAYSVTIAGQEVLCSDVVN